METDPEGMSTTSSSTWPKDEREGWGVLMLLEALHYNLNLPFIPVLLSR